MKRVEMFFLTLLAIASTACDKDEDPYVETPEERYEVVGITYEKRAGDQVTCHEVSFPVKSIVNNTDIPIDEAKMYSDEEVTSNSRFITDQEFEVPINSTSVRVPTFLNGEMKDGTLSEDTWSYSTNKEETKTVRFVKTVVLSDIPPRTTIKVTLLAMVYNATLTYTANLRSLTSGKTLTLQGKWNGRVIQEGKIEVKNGDGVLIETMPVNP